MNLLKMPTEPKSSSISEILFPDFCMTDLVYKKECKMFPIGLTCGKHSFSPSTTLSDLLKQSGIKECKSKKNKKPGDIKKKTKYYYEKYLKNGYQATINRIQELKNPPKNLLSPIEKESSNEELEIEEILSKKSENYKNESEKEEILVSLNFIDDCQKYKKKKIGVENRINNFSRYIHKYQKPYLRKEFQKSEGPTPKSSYEIQLCKDRQNDNLSIEDFQRKESFLEWTLKDETDNILSEAPVWGKPSAKQSSGDVSKIDKNYLESLISITKRTQCKIMPFLDIEEIKDDNAQKNQSHVLKKKKKNSHQETTRKTDKNKLHAENLENAKEIPINILEDLPKLSREREVLPTVFRNLTKSDQQVKLNRDKNSPAPKREKPGTHSKPVINDIRKKRTPRNKCLKNEADAFIETSIPGEVINTDVVQELWTRTSKKTSENSLTSASSAYAPEIDDIRNLDSYKYLSKLVQEEITHIVNKSGAKAQRGTEKSKSSVEAPEKSKEVRKKLQNSTHGNSSEIQIFKSEAKNPLHKKKQQNPQLPAFFADDIPKEVNCSLLKKKAKEDEKLPSKAIENWSIMNRLEQAFLALVTPTFQDKKKKSATPPKTPNSVKDASQKFQTTEKAVNKKPARSKNVSVKKDIKDHLNPDSSQTKNILPTARTSHSPLDRKIQNEKTNALHEKHGGNDQKKNSKPQQLQVNYLKISKNTENNIKSKKKKKTSTEQNQNLLEGKIYKKDGKGNLTKMPRVPLIPARAEPSEISLERKSTFSVIRLTSSKNIIHQPRKSKGCNKSDGNITICYLKTNNKENQLPTEQNLIGQPKLSKSNGNEEGIKKTSTNTHKRLTKTSLKMEPSPERETPKNSEEKTSLIENSEKPRLVQQKKTERTEEIRPNTPEKKKDYNEPPVQNLPVLKINSSSTNSGKVRAVKKRSILSVHANQVCNEPPVLQQIQEKDNMDICVFYPNASEQEYVRDLNTSQITVIITHSNTSITSTTTYVNECNQNYSSHTGALTAAARVQESSDISPECCSDTMFSSVTECRTQPSDSTFEKITLGKESWERDLSHYHQIVREIMSQYNRIDGLLKQSEKVNTLASDGTGSSTKSSAESKLISLREYRKRIISEYEALPNFEYKSKILENTGGNLNLADAKRNLAVVKDTETYEDEDVKDHHPRMKKILDSQLYVEPENLVQRIEHKEKLLPKNSSLQDVHLSKNGELCKIMGERLKSFSTKIFHTPQYSHVTLCGSQGATSKESCLEYLSSLSGLDYFMQSETETETS